MTADKNCYNRPRTTVPWPDPFASTGPERAAAQRRIGLRMFAKGHSLGRYKILEMIGQGGMGTVFSAHDPDIDRRVAIKVVNADLADAPQCREALLTDARAAANVRHPAVIQIYDCGVDRDVTFVVMEFVEGTTLRQWLREHHRSWQDIVGIYIRAGRGLLAVHDAGLVHRDFKPSNVLIDTDGNPRVVDFGLARACRPSTQSHPGDPSIETTQRAGTLRYMAPEQFECESIGPRSDQYAFCVCLYEALFGHHPFYRKDNVLSHQELIRLHHRWQFGQRREIPHKVIQLALQGLATNPQDRHASLRSLLDELAHASSTPKRSHSTVMLIVMVLTMFGFLSVSVPTEGITRILDDASSAAERLLRRIGISLSEELNDLAIRRIAESTCLPRSEIYTASALEEARSWEANPATAYDFTQFSLNNASCELLSTAAPGLRPRDIKRFLQQLQRVRAIWFRHQHDPGEELRYRIKQPLEDMVHWSRSTGHSNLIAWALVQRGWYLAHVGAYEDGMSSLEDANRVLATIKAPALGAMLELATVQSRLDHATTHGSARAAVVDDLRESLRNARELLKQSDDPTLLDVPLALTEANLAWHAGEFRNSVEIYRSLRDREFEDYSRPSMHTIALAHGLALRLLRIDEPNEAEQIIRPMLAYSAEELGQDHPGLALLHDALGTIFDSRGRLREASAEFNKALESIGNRPGLRKTRISVLNKLANGAYNSGATDAQERFEQVLVEKTELFGDNHPQLMWTLDPLAELALDAGAHEQAQRYAQWRLDIALAEYEPESIETAMAYMLMGKVHLETNALDKAEPLLEQAYELLWPREAHARWRAESAFVYGRYLHTVGEHERAHALVIDARELLVTTDDKTRLLGDIRRWLARHSP